jgi:threonine/homoserine/homoserine lactone efflux protein
MVFEAFVFGLFLAVAVGPIALLIVNYGIRFGLVAAIRSALGAATGDLVFAAAAFVAGAALAPFLAQQQEVIAAASGIVLIGFGFFMLRSTFRSKPAENKDSEEVADAGRPFLTTFFLTVANPLTVVAFAGFVTRLKQPLTMGAALEVLLALFVASLSVQLVFAFGGATAGRIVSDPKRVRALNILGAVGIIAYGMASFVA